MEMLCKILCEKDTYTIYIEMCGRKNDYKEVDRT